MSPARDLGVNSLQTIATPPGVALVARAGDRAFHSPAADIEADKVAVRGDHVLGRRIGDARILQIDQRLERRELRRVFAQVSAERNLGDFLAEEPVTAEDDADLAGARRSLGDEPGRGSPLLAVVPADIGRGGLGPEFGQNGERRHASRPQGRDRVADARVIDRDDGDRVRALAEPKQALGDDGGRKVRREFHHRFAAKPGEPPGRCGEIGAELRIERVLPLQAERRMCAPAGRRGSDS